ncbi:MAG: endonuclease/exonuclease/phosphatase family protein [Candidatus Methylomirabilia bacterium]
MIVRNYGPRVLLGDFNERLPGSLAPRLAPEFSLLLRRRRTHPALFPVFSLDRIYWDTELGGERPMVHRSRLACVASDHLPVVACLRLPD